MDKNAVVKMVCPNIPEGRKQNFNFSYSLFFFRFHTSPEGILVKEHLRDRVAVFAKDNSITEVRFEEESYLLPMMFRLLTNSLSPSPMWRSTSIWQTVWWSVSIAQR